jgi:endonuclease YncB( thermonuclease family)
MFKTLVLSLMFFLHGTATWAAAPITVTGQVSRVTDGDSLWLTLASSGQPLQLRLLGIDAPEICQPWGEQAKQALAELVLGKQVTVHTQGQDTYGRTLATVFVDAVNVNKTLVQEGHAWSTRYKFDRGPFVADERMAKALSRGLNRDGGAVMPKEFRRSHGPCVVAESMPPSAVTVTPATNVAATAPSVPLASLSTSNAAYRCDGRTYCSQMHSCAEATYFLRHCPGVKMDGNNDGVPCEKQWCTPGR